MKRRTLSFAGQQLAAILAYVHAEEIELIVDMRDPGLLRRQVNRMLAAARPQSLRCRGQHPSAWQLPRAGEDPRTSVVDRDGRLHSLDNVYVADGSYMPYPGGLNPTLTIQANALRIALLIAHEATGHAGASRALQSAAT